MKSKNLVANVVMCRRYSLTKFASFLIIVLRAEIALTFLGRKKICKLCKARFSAHYNNFSTKLWDFTTFERFFSGISFFSVWICLDQKLVQNGNCLFYSLRKRKEWESPIESPMCNHPCLFRRRNFSRRISRRISQSWNQALNEVF